MHSFSRISVLGLGYIGLPTAAVFAENGVEVVGVDIDPRVVETINAGRPHFGEPNLDALVRRVVEGGKLRATAVPEPADAFIIAVPTPLRGHGEDAKPDLSYVEAVIKDWIEPDEQSPTWAQLRTATKSVFWLQRHPCHPLGGAPRSGSAAVNWGAGKRWA